MYICIYIREVRVGWGHRTEWGDYVGVPLPVVVPQPTHSARQISPTRNVRPSPAARGGGSR